jgi:PAP2 superfamily
MSSRQHRHRHADSAPAGPATGRSRHSGLVQNAQLTWQQSGLLAASLAGLSLTLRRAGPGRLRRLAPFAGEAGVIAALYALWQLAGTLSVLGTSGAMRRAADIAALERDWHLPSESSVQQLITGHPLLVEASNLYYATMHFGALFGFLFWLFLRHREQYRQVRSILVSVTLLCLLVQLLPVAPPRLLPGYVDTAVQYGQSVYGLGLAPDELSAMPSVHVAWALLIAWVTLRIGSGGWRWLGPAHAALTTFVVVATANHFWLDGLVAAALLACCVLGQQQLAARRARDTCDVAAADVLSPVLSTRILRS